MEIVIIFVLPNSKEMTIQDLKENRNEIISFINSRSYDLKFAMEIAVEFAPNCDDIEELKNELIQYCTPVKRESKLAEMISNANEGQTFNHLTKEWSKN